MILPVWPLTLPRPLKSDWKRDATDIVIRSKVDRGAAKTRPRDVVGLKTMVLSFRMSAPQVSTFIAFWEQSLAFGALEFQFPDPFDGSTLAVRPNPAKYTETPFAGTERIIAFTVEILP